MIPACFQHEVHLNHNTSSVAIIDGPLLWTVSHSRQYNQGKTKQNNNKNSGRNNEKQIIHAVSI